MNRRNFIQLFAASLLAPLATWRAFDRRREAGEALAAKAVEHQRRLLQGWKNNSLAGWQDNALDGQPIEYYRYPESEHYLVQGVKVSRELLEDCTFGNPFNLTLPPRAG